MLAYRNRRGQVEQIRVDVAPDGSPILPPDTTVDPRPEPLEGHYVTVVGRAWVQIPKPVPFKTFETKRQDALAALSTYKNWYLEQPVIHNGVKFDADKTARERLTQAVVGLVATGSHVPFWVAHDDTPYNLPDGDTLKALAVDVVQTHFGARFYEMNALREQILAVADGDEAALAAIVIPTIPTDLF